MLLANIDNPRQLKLNRKATEVRRRIVSSWSILLPLRTGARLDDYGDNIGLNPILFNGGKEGFQIDFLVFYAEFGPDVVPMKIDGAFRQMHHFRDGLGAVALANEVGHLQFSVREP